MDRTDDPEGVDVDSEADADADEWRFGLDEVDEHGVVQEREPLEPGRPAPENVFFVLVGVALALVLLSGLI